MKFILDAITNEIFLKIPEIKNCISYAKGREELDAPVVFLGITNYSAGHDPATGQLALVAHVEARVVIDSTIDDAEFIVQNLACKIANVAHLNSFGEEISPAVILSISKDEFHPDFDVYLCWLIEWSHEMHVGESVWNNEQLQIPVHTIVINGDDHHAV
ncbi:hypothetical protein FACS1894126_3980 [Alphaproteobacteria bacterium]|nr:hypothetical protein FACS1894126_3980 [Alphaproteobacteria bacterium]